MNDMPARICAPPEHGKRGHDRRMSSRAWRSCAAHARRPSSRTSTATFLALEAVLADLERQRLDRLVCLGDICFGPQAHECLARVRELGCPVVLGNWDSLVDRRLPAGRRPGRDHALRDRRAGGRSSSPTRTDAFVRTFVPTLDVPLEDGRACSASTARRTRSPTGSSRRRPTTTSSTMFDGVDAPVLVGGHTHLQMLRRFGRR